MDELEIECKDDHLPALRAGLARVIRPARTGPAASTWLVFLAILSGDVYNPPRKGLVRCNRKDCENSRKVEHRTGED